MKNFKKYFSLDNPKSKNFFDNLMYQKYLKELTSKNSSKEIDITHLENIFNNPLYYFAMKKVPKLEKKVLYLNICENGKLDNICKQLKLSRKQVINLREKGIKHFKDNLKKLEKENS